MKKFLLLLFLISSIIFGQEKELYFKSFKPEFVSRDSEFEVSTVISFLDENIDEAEFYILVEDNVVLKSAAVNNDGKKFKLNVSSKQFGEYVNKSYLLKLENSLLTFNSPFQIVLRFAPLKNRLTEISFGLIYNLDGRRSAVYSSFETTNSKFYLPSIKVDPYSVQQIAGNALQLADHSKLKFEIENDEDYKNILIEFWAKFYSPDFNFLSLINPEFSDTLLSLCFDNYQMISSKDISKVEDFNENFFSIKNWNHYSIYISKETSTAKIYSNGNKIFSSAFEFNAAAEKLEVVFKNEIDNQPYDLDLLRVWNFDNDIEKSFSNRNNITYKADSSKILYNLNFDKIRDAEDLESYKVESKNIKFVKSDAPIFSRAPELNIKIYDKFFSIDWVGKDIVHAKEFILEKSNDGSSFHKIFSIDAEEDANKIYFYSDEKNPEDEIVYYRLRQINKDGSEVFSAPIKIGQGLKDIFSLDQNFPNPFNPSTVISVEMFEAAEVEISVYDIVGNKIEKLHQGSLSQGIHTFTFNGVDLPSGIYFYEIKSPFTTLVRKMILAK
jgi:hypothetical protein